MESIAYVRGDQYEGVLHTGQRVYSGLYGGRHGIISAIKGEQSPDTIKDIGFIVMGGSAEIDVVFDDHISRGIPEGIIRGVQWEISDTVVSVDILHDALLNAEAAMAAKQEAKERRAMEKAAEAERLPKEFPYLTRAADSGKSSAATGAANIRKELARAFPGVKFSVKSEYYSGGCSIGIHWTDGPTRKQVLAITDKYRTCDFDGMTDSESTRDTVWPRVFGGANYVQCQRSLSPEHVKRAAETLGYTLSESNFGKWGELIGLDYNTQHQISNAAHELPA